MKLLIFGIVASGKTTLAAKLALKYNIPHYEGDCIAYGFPGEERYKRTDSQQQSIISEIDEKGQWIIEGTYRESQKCLFEMADVIVFLDIPLSVRLARILTRHIKQRLGIESCNYTPNLKMLKAMLKWTYCFEKKRDMYEKMLLDHGNKLIWVKSHKELEGELPLIFIKRGGNK